MSTEYSNTYLSLRSSAVIAGVAYLVAIFVTPFGWINPLIIIGDATTTYSNVSSQLFLLRLAIACWLVVIVADTIVGWALYQFFYRVNKSLSLLAMILRFIFAPIMALAVFQWLGALQVISGTSDTAAAAQNAMFFFTMYEYAVNIAFMVFGLHVGVIGYLAFKSGYVPRIIGIALIIACVGYQIDTYASILSADYNANPNWFLITIAAPAFFSEFMFTLWLLYRGWRLPESS